MAAIHFELKSLLTKNVLGGGDPTARSQGEPFTFYYCRDTEEMFFTDAVGNFINFGSVLAAVLNGSMPLALPASPVVGPKGEKGDSIVGPKGEKGDSIVGPQGPAGPPGDVTIVGNAELEGALRKLRSERARIQAALLIEIADAEGLHPVHRAYILGVVERLKKEIL
jgi:hypothetical protein